MSNYWSRLRRHKISRRTMLGASAKAGVGAAGLALVGCGGDDDDDDDAPAAAAAEEQAEAQAEQVMEEEEQAEEQAMEEEEEAPAPMVSRYDTEATLNIGYPAFPASLDVNTDQGGAGVTNYLHFDPLYAIDRGRNHLASGGYANWEYVDDNGALLITVQPGVTFHDGEPLDAERVQWWFERNLGIADYNPDYVSGIAARIAFIGDMKVVDDLTLHMVMDPPSVNAPEQTGGGNSHVVPRDYIVEHGDEHFARNPVGFGPYTFTSFTPDQRMESERWDDWFFPNPADEGPLNYYGNWAKTVVARYFPEESSRIAALEAGEIDVADRLSPDGAALFEDSDDHHVITVSGLRVMGIELPFNQSLDPITGGPNPWRDKRVREAANYALDREAIIANLLTGLELPAVSPFPAGYDLPLGPSGYRDFDPDRARALLEEAGQVGFQIRLHIATGLWGDERWVPAIQQYLNDVGFVCEVDYLDFGGALQEVRDHVVPYPFLMSQNGATKNGSPAGAGFAWTLIGAIDNPYTHTNADDDFVPGFLDFQALIEEANVTFDEDKRNDLYWDAAVIWYEEAYNIPLFNLSHLHGARKDISYQGWLHSDPGLNPRYLGVST
ncbi:MAG: ABC transporter substrate-binding protein [Chloroflexi bacterium]|nr:ABC transporter substrate-binding protein [Chloroflexota bacterium]